MADAITDGYPGALTPAQLKALPALTLNDFHTLTFYQTARRVGMVNIGTTGNQNWEDRFEMIPHVINPGRMAAELLIFENDMKAAPGGVFKLDLRGTWATVLDPGGTVTVNFGTAAATIHWGDGVTEAYVSGNKSHTYAAGKGYILTIDFNDVAAVTTISITGNIGDTASFETLTSLTSLTVTGGKLLSTPGLPPQLTTLDVRDNLITRIEGLPWALTTLRLSNNPINYIQPPGQVITLLIKSISMGNAFQLPPTVKTLDASTGIFNSTAIGSMLAQLDSYGLTSGSATMNGQTPAAPAVGAGLTAKNNLVAKSWTVVTD